MHDFKITEIKASKILSIEIEDMICPVRFEDVDLSNIFTEKDIINLAY